MKALRISKIDDAVSLIVEELTLPEPGPGDLLVKIRASAVQPSDIMNSKGAFAITTFPRTIGAFQPTTNYRSNR